jgi:hypothetical protein
MLIGVNKTLRAKDIERNESRNSLQFSPLVVTGFEVTKQKVIVSLCVHSCLVLRRIRIAVVVQGLLIVHRTEFLDVSVYSLIIGIYNKK